MAYNLDLAAKLRDQLSGTPGLSERKMFGGIAFMLHGNMAVGVNGDEIMVRVGPEAYANAVIQPNVRPFDMTGRPMRGWVVVTPAGYADPAELAHWVGRGASFAQTLPPKG